jgi:hypothetical protein
MQDTASGFTASGLTDLLSEISSVLGALDGQTPDATAQAVLSGYAGQVNLLAAAKHPASVLPRGMRRALRGVAYGLQMLAGEMPGPKHADLTTLIREVRQLLAVLRREADTLNLPPGNEAAHGQLSRHNH